MSKCSKFIQNYQLSKKSLEPEIEHETIEIDGVYKVDRYEDISPGTVQMDEGGCLSIMTKHNNTRRGDDTGE
jgi:hypothetical protein